MAVLNEGKKLASLNISNIVLILKISYKMNLVNFRPISLYIVLYKVVANMVANQFHKVLEDYIDGAQSVFVPRRLISDNVLLAYEILHSFHKKRLGNKGFMTLKLDMSKAYDRVE